MTTSPLQDAFSLTIPEARALFPIVRRRHLEWLRAARVGSHES
jgi:hypothetical protein